MTTRTEEEPMAVEEDLDPWARWSWLMGAIWLFFLVFPIQALLESSYDVTLRALELVSIGVFVVVYVGGFIRMGRAADAPSRRCSSA
jgi:two-component system sensor histidine kinase DesK